MRLFVLCMLVTPVIMIALVAVAVYGLSLKALGLIAVVTIWQAMMLLLLAGLFGAFQRRPLEGDIFYTVRR